ncbi:MAG: hypothetical protein ACLVBP_12425 [Ruminococcus sp.]
MEELLRVHLYADSTRFGRCSSKKGEEKGWEGYFNQWVVDNLGNGDVVVADMFDKVYNGTFVGGNLTTAINVKTE